MILRWSVCNLGSALSLRLLHAIEKKFPIFISKRTKSMEYQCPDCPYVYNEDCLLYTSDAADE